LAICTSYLKLPGANGGSPCPAGGKLPHAAIACLSPRLRGAPWLCTWHGIWPRHAFAVGNNQHMSPDNLQYRQNSCCRLYPLQFSTQICKLVRDQGRAHNEPLGVGVVSTCMGVHLLHFGALLIVGSPGLVLIMEMQIKLSHPHVILYRTLSLMLTTLPPCHCKATTR
jgi:hypothetical protein